MADEKNQGFSHIVVGGDFDDDDVVIVAGAPSEGRAATANVPAQMPEPDAESMVAEQPGSDQVLADEAYAAQELDPAPMEEPETASAPEPAEPAPAKSGRAQSSGKKDDYRGTTLEDLESEKMPTTQKVVIVAAVVLIIAAIAWFLMH